MKFLNVCVDPDLLQLRGRYLQALGFAVVNARDVASAIAALRFGEKFDLAILCHTLPDHQKLQLEVFTRRAGASITVLELYITDPPVTSGASLDATTEFLPLMASWAQSLEETNPEQVTVRARRGPEPRCWSQENLEQPPSSHLVH